MPRVTRTDQAEFDLVEILVGIARHSVQAAARLRDEFEQTTRMLAGSPRIGRERQDLHPDLRSHPVAGRFVIFYRVADEGIEVVRVLHGSRDIGQLFDG
jgi:toxin ParE1/3/4